jgi:acyl-CoA oxidase
VFATHAVLAAQLIINNKKHGPAYFVLRIRDDKTHKPVEGVEVGDIGPKYGYNAKDNGYLKLTNFKIPRENMLMKFTKVSKDGEFERRGNEKISYATMLTIRTRIPISCFYTLSKAITIATRYSLIRKQFKNDAGNEIQIFDYQLQQEKIIPHIAESYATFFAFKQCTEMAINVIKEATEKNEFARLNPTHSLSSSVKAVTTSDTLKAMEILRRSAGGHGFSSYSGLPQLQTEIAPSATYEG